MQLNSPWTIFLRSPFHEPQFQPFLSFFSPFPTVSLDPELAMMDYLPAEYRFPFPFEMNPLIQFLVDSPLLICWGALSFTLGKNFGNGSYHLIYFSA